MIYTEKTYKYLLFCGDIHGKYDIIPNFIRDNELDTCAVFQVGDFGIGFLQDHNEQKRLKYLNNRMKHSNSDLFTIRGNHDNPKYFYGNTILSNVRLMKDYDIININGWNILGIGGANSIDRVDRTGWWDKKTNDWWEDEVIDYNEDILTTLTDIDIVITHSAPDFCEPLIKNNLYHWMTRDDKIETDISIERYLLTRIYEILSIKNNISDWYYGHFHYNFKTYRDNTSFTGLDINKIIENNKIYNNGEK